MSVDKALFGGAEQRLTAAAQAAAPDDAGSKRRWKALHGGAGGLEAVGNEEAFAEADDRLERILGRNDLIDIRFFERMAERARAVCRLDLDDGRGFGTGWLVNRSLLMTNNHVLPDVSTARGAVMEFEVERKGATGKRFKLDPDRLFITSPKGELDYTLVAVRAEDEAQLAAYGSLPLAPQLVPLIAIGEPLNIIQHPDGAWKRYAIRENEVIAAQPSFLLYRTDTNPGSSGSPVFNNDWAVVALHHSGVPRRNAQQQILTRKGTIWNGVDDDLIDWIANEGVRIDAILGDIRRRATQPAAKQLLGTLTDFKEVSDFHVDVRTPANPVDTPAVTRFSGGGTSSGVSVVAPSSGGSTTSFVIPLQVQISVSVGPTVSGSPPPVSTAKPPAPPARTVDEALERLARVTPANYYDATKDRAERDDYYRSINLATSDPSALYDALSAQLARTHTTTLSYKDARIQYLYPVVDLVREGNALFLQSLYSGDRYTDPSDFLREAFRVTEAFEAKLAELTSRESSLSEEAFALEVDALEASAGFNCEHVVPQSWFKKRPPMVSDLHHLFTCDAKCNSRRSNLPLTDFPEFPASEGDDPCGMAQQGRFEPRNGKGAAARAILYFLVRHPEKISRQRYAPADIGMLKEWSAKEPPGEWERHRNAEIFKVQGNRNPFIDFPELVRKVDFLHGLGRG